MKTAKSKDVNKKDVKSSAAKDAKKTESVKKTPQAAGKTAEKNTAKKP